MLREIYLKAEFGQTQVHLRQKHNQSNLHNSSINCSSSSKNRFLFTVWLNKFKKSSASSPSQHSVEDSHQTLDVSNASVNGFKKNQIQFKIKNDQQTIIDDENKTALINYEIQKNQCNLKNSDDFDNLKDLTKDENSSSKSNFCKTRKIVKKQLSCSMNEKESSIDLAFKTSNIEQHASGHRTSILVSLRAASILLPLYGLHYLVFVYRLDTTVCWLSELYHYCSITLDGLQGMLVSILFCFATNEVQQVIRRSFMDRSRMS